MFKSSTMAHVRSREINKNRTARMTNSNYAQWKLQVARVFIYTWATIAHAVAWLARRLRTSVRAPMAGEEHVDTEWLTVVLRSKGLLNGSARVTSATLSETDANRGFASVVRRLAVVAQDEQAGSRPVEFALFLKRTFDSVAGRKDVIVGGWCREAQFLDCAEFVSLPAIADRTQTVLHASALPWLGEYAVLMHDATRPPFSASGLNFLFGNQIWGHDGKMGDDEQILDSLERTWLAGARIHGALFNDRAALARHEWMRGVSWLLGKGELRWQLSFATTLASWRTMQAKFATLRFDDRLRRLIVRSIEGSSWERFQHDLQNNAVGLCHGDFHASNMMFTGRGQNFHVHMFDWSEVGVAEPAADIGQMVVSDVPAKLHSRLRPLLRAYHEALCAPADYTLSRFEADFARATISRWVFLTVLMCGFPVPLPLLQYFHDQLLSFVENFGDLENGTYYLNGMVQLMQF
jgi:hypothetical protein